jgi:hypothetical protein
VSFGSRADLLLACGEDALCFEAVKAHERVDDPAVSKIELNIEGIQLIVEGHGLAAFTYRGVRLPHQIRLAANAVSPSAHWYGGSSAASSLSGSATNLEGGI